MNRCGVTLQILYGLLLTCVSSFSSNCLAAGPVGYVWPKREILLPDTDSPHFKPLKVGAIYPLVTQTETGYLVPCEMENGGTKLGLLPFRDRLRNATATRVDGDSSGRSIQVISSLVKPKAGFFALLANKCYTVSSTDKNKLGVLTVNGGTTSTVYVTAEDVKFVSLADYAKFEESLTNNLKKLADEELLTKQGWGNFGSVFEVGRLDITDDTREILMRLAIEYEEMAYHPNAKIVASRERVAAQFAAEQTAKGLIKYQGEWLTTNEVRQAAERYERALELWRARREGSVEIVQWSWHKEAFGSIMVADFAIRNTTPVAVKDITITCVHTASSGTKVDSNTRTIYKKIPAGETLRINGFNMGFIHEQTSQSAASIDDYKVVE